MSILPSAFFAFLSLLVISGCSANMIEGLHSKQKVSVESIPSGASIYLNGELVGETPISLNLRSDISHEISIQKKGFNPIKEYLDPVYKHNKKPYVQFGLTKDLGYYYQLSSNFILSELQWSSLPNTTGIDPFKSMSELITEADNKYSSGDLTEEEHKIVTRQIIKLFNSK